MTTARGKIGRLPVELRHQVNSKIRDNKTFPTIITFLEKEGVKGITRQNLTSWKANGYLSWLRRQERLDGMRARVEFAQAMAKDSSGGLALESEAASRLAVDSIMEVLEGFDPTLLKDLLAEKPEKFVALVESLASLRKGDHAYVALRMKFEDWRRKVRQHLDQLKEKAEAGTATPEDINSIISEVYGG